MHSEPSGCMVLFAFQRVLAMTRVRSSSLAAFLVLCQIIGVSSTQQCEEEYSIYGMMLKKHIFKKIKASNWNACVQACEDDVRCQSMNYVIGQEMCELNNRTKEARPEDFVSNDERWYMKRFKKRVFLGSIPELPAESCKEIKASEGEIAVSGRYWFNSIEPGETLFALCDMITEDIDECSVSNGGCEQTCVNTPGSSACTCYSGYYFNEDKKTCHDIDECSESNGGCEHGCTNTPGSSVCTCNPGYDLEVDLKSCKDVNECATNAHNCDVNAVCTNDEPSFHCTCYEGYTGNGISCTDIDECALGSPGCLPTLASCINTDGSYNCTCNHGYVGDGRISCQPEECLTYTNLSKADRKGSHPYNPNDPKCDDDIGPGWFRFEGAAGTRIVTSCPMPKVCSAYMPGWMNGTHPTVADGKISRRVCFRWDENCCYKPTNIQVRNCRSYYVYHLHGTPVYGCYARYCSAD